MSRRNHQRGLVSQNRQRKERRRRKDLQRLIGRRPAWERLEPRIVLASNLSLVQDAGEATLEYDQAAQMLTLTQGQSVLTADPANGAVIIEGTPGDDHLNIGEIPVDAEVWFQGGVGDDVLALLDTFVADDPAVPGQPIVFDGGSDLDTIQVSNDVDMLLSDSQLALSDSTGSFTDTRTISFDQRIDAANATTSTGIGEVEWARLIGGSGANTLDASGFSSATGGVVMEGGDGNDVLIGGPSDTRYVFSDGFGNDTLTELASGGNDVLDFRGVTGPLTYSSASKEFTAGTDTLTQASGEAEEIDLALQSAGVLNATANALIAGLNQLKSVASSVNSESEFTNQIPVLEQFSDLGVPGNLAGISDWNSDFATTLDTLSSRISGGGRGLSHLVSELNAIDPAAAATTRYREGSDGSLEVLLEFVSSHQQNGLKFGVDSGPDADFYGLDLDGEYTVDGSSTIPVTLGIATAETGNDKFFTTSSTSFSATVDGSAPVTTTDLGIAFLETTVSSGGTLALNGTHRVDLVDPDDADGLGRITLTDLGNLSLSQSAATTSTLFPTGLSSSIPIVISDVNNLSSANLQLTVASGDLFDGGVTQIIGAAGNGGDILEFANIAPVEVIGMLNRLADSYQAIANQPEFDQLIPLTGHKVRDVMDFRQTFFSSVIDPLYESGEQANPDNDGDGQADLTFKNIQELATALQGISNATVTPTYNPDPDGDATTPDSEVQLSLEFDFNASTAATSPAVDPSLDFGAQVPGLHVANPSSPYTIDSTISFDFDFGIQLGASEAVELTPSVFQAGPRITLTKLSEGGPGSESYELRLVNVANGSTFTLGDGSDESTGITWNGASMSLSDVEKAIEGFSDYTNVTVLANAADDTLTITVDDPITNVPDLQIIDASGIAGAATNGQLLDTATFSVSVVDSPAIFVVSVTDGDSDSEASVPMPAKETQRIELLRATGGTFRISYTQDADPGASDQSDVDVETSDLAYDASATVVESELQSLGLNVTVTKTLNAFEITFEDNPVTDGLSIEANEDLPLFVADGSGLIGNAVSITLNDVQVTSDSANTSFSDLVDDVQGNLNQALHNEGWTLGLLSGSGDSAETQISVSSSAATAAAAPYSAAAISSPIPHDLTFDLRVGGIDPAISVQIRRADVESSDESNDVDKIAEVLQQQIIKALSDSNETTVSGVVVDNDNGKLRFVTSSGTFTLNERPALEVVPSASRMVVVAPAVTDSADSLQASVLMSRALQVSVGALVPSQAGYFDSSFQELGLQTSPTPFNGVLVDDVEFEIIVTSKSSGTQSFSISLPASSTSGNSSIDDLVSVLNQHLPAGLVDAVRLTPGGNRIALRGAVGEVTRLALDVSETVGANPNGAITGLGFEAGRSKVQRARSAEFFIDNAAVNTSFSVDAASVTESGELGFLSVDLSGAIDGMSDELSGEIDVDLRNPFDGGTRLTFGTGFDNLADGLRSGQLEFDSTVADGSLNPKQDAPQTGPLVLTTSSDLDIDWTVTPTGLVTGLNSASVTLELDLADWLDSPDSLPTLRLTSATQDDADQYVALQEIELAVVKDALQEIAGFLGNFDRTSSSPAISQLGVEIPLINRSMADLLDLSGPFGRRLDDLFGSEIQSVQQLEGQIQRVFGSGAGLSLNSSGELVFAIPFDATQSKSLPIGVDVSGVVNAATHGFIDSFNSLSASGRVDASIDSSVNLDFGLDLTSEDVLLKTGTTLDFKLNVDDSVVNFDGQFGPFPVMVLDGVEANGSNRDANVEIGARIQAALASTTDVIIAAGVGSNSIATSIPALTASISNEQLDANFPLYTGSVNDPIAVPVDNLLTVSAASPFSSPAINLPELDPTFSTPPTLFSLINDPNVFVRGLDQVLEAIQDSLNGQFFGMEIPTIGPALAGNPAAQFVEDLRASVIQPLSDFLLDNDLTLDASVTEIQTILDDAFRNVLTGGTVTSSRTGFTDANQAATFIQLDYVISDEIEIPLGDLEFDLALPFLGFNADFEPVVTVAWALDLGFGVDESQGFYVNVDGDPEIEIDLKVDFGSETSGVPATASGTLGPLFLSVTDGIARTSESGGTEDDLYTLIDVSAEFDIVDPSSDGRIVVGELAQLQDEPEDFLTAKSATGFVDVFLGFEVDFAALDSSLKQALPNIRAELLVHQEFELDTDGFTFGQPRIALGNVEMSLGSFFGDFLGPILNNVGDFLRPFEFLVGTDGLLNERLPLISELAGESVSFKDLVFQFDPNAKILPFLEAFEELFYLIDLAEEADGELQGDDIWLEFGSMVVSDDAAIFGDSFFGGNYVRGGEAYNLLGITPLDLNNPFGDIAFTALFDIGSVDLFDFENIAEGTDSQQLENKKNAKKTGKKIVEATKKKKAAKSVASSTTKGVTDSGGIDFPILEPTNLFSLLLGLEDVSLFEYELPEFGFNFYYRQNFPVVSFLAATFSGEFDSAIDVGFGYDTRGLRQFVASQNPNDLLDGFYVNDINSETGEDRPELRFSVSVGIGAALSAAVITAGVEGGVTANLFFDLADLDGDGRIRFDEFAANLAANNSDPLSIFDVTGNLEFFMKAFLEFNLLVTTFREEYEFLRVELANFDVSDFNRPPILADQSGSDLILNIGPNAANRLSGDTSDGDETIYVKTDGTKVSVWNSSIAESDAQEFTGVSRIVAIGGVGDDMIDLSGVADSTIEIEVRGDEGDDTILGGAGADLLLGGRGDDVIKGGAGDDTIRGEGGVDTLEGGAGADSIDGGNGADILYDNDANGQDTDVDTLIGGAGDDTINGGANDLVLGLGQASTDTLLGVGLTLDLADITDNVTVVLKGTDFYAYWGNVTLDDLNNDGFFDPSAAGEVSEGSGKLFTGALSSLSKVVTGSGDDTFHVFDTDGSNTALLDGVDGSDTYIFYGDSSNSGIDASVTDTGARKLYVTDTVLLRSAEGIDSAAATDDSFPVSDSHVEFDQGHVSVNYSAPGSTGSLLEVIVEAGAGSDSVVVESTSASVAVRVDGGAGDDVLSVGGANGVNDIDGVNLSGPDTGPLVFVGGAGYDAVIIDDSADGNGGSGSLGAFIEPRGGGATTVEVGVVRGFGMGIDVEFEGSELLDLRLGSGAETVAIGEDLDFFGVPSNAVSVSTFSGTTLVNGAGGDDEFGVLKTQDLSQASHSRVALSVTTSGVDATDSSAGTSQVVELQLTGELGWFVLEFDDPGNDQTVPGAEQSVPLSIAALVDPSDAASAETSLKDALESLRLVGPGFSTVQRSATDPALFTITFDPSLGSLPVLSAYDTSLLLRGEAGADTFNLQSLDQPTYVLGGVDRDDIRLNVELSDQGAVQLDGTEPKKASLNGVNDLLTVDGQDSGDSYLAYLFGGDAHSQINIFDSGAASDGNDALELRGTDSDDLFLLRSAVAEDGLALIAMLKPSVPGASTSVERVNYNKNLDAIQIFGLAGEDAFAVDDTRANIEIYGGEGNDFFQIGQLYKTQRNAAAGIPFADVFATVETTRGFLSNGISAPMTIYGGNGEDQFIVYRNQAPLVLEGDAGDDNFLVRAFALVGSTEDLRDTTDIVGGADADTIEYSVNAPVNIDGGDGLDTVIVIGTEFNDDFVVTENGIYGAGLNINYVGVEFVEVDAAEGDDRFFIAGTAANRVTQLTGGLGSDSFTVNGPTPDVISNDLLGHSGLITHGVSSNLPEGQARYAGAKVVGVSANVADDDEPALRILKSDGTSVISQAIGDTDTYQVVLTRRPENSATVIVKAFAPDGVVFTAIDGAGLPPQDDDDAINLVFDETNWNTARTVTFAADSSVVIDGIGSGFITHEIATEAALGTVGAVAGVEGDKVSGLSVSQSVSIGDRFLSINLPQFLTDQGDDVLRGAQISVIDGAGVGQSQLIVGNTSTQIEVSTGWSVALDTSSRIEILRFSGVVAPTVDVNVVGSGSPALDVRQSGASTFAAESVSIHGFGGDGDQALRTVDSITVALANEPSGLVTVDLSADDSAGNGQLRFVIDDGNGFREITSLTFETSNWDQAQEVFVIGAQDQLTEGLHKASLKLAASGGGYDQIESAHVVDIADNEVASVLVLESENETNVVEFGNGGLTATEIPDVGTTDTYQIVLSRAPATGETVTVQLNADPTRTQRGAGTFGIRAFAPEVVVSTDGVNYSTSQSVTFTSQDWYKPKTISVQANQDQRVDGGDSKSFAATLEQANQIEGPLVINGGINDDRINDLEREPVMLLQETNSKAAIGSVIRVNRSGTRIFISKSDRAEIESSLGFAINRASDFVGLTIEITGGPGKNKSRVVRNVINGSNNWVLVVDQPWQSGLTSEKPDSTSSYTLSETNPNFLVNEIDQRDILVVNDRDNVTSSSELPSGSLSIQSDRLSGLGMAEDQLIGGNVIVGGITYGSLEELEINLGPGANEIVIDSTHRGATAVHSGAGRDGFEIKSISGHTFLNGGADADTFTVSNDLGRLEDIGALLTVAGDVPEVVVTKLANGSAPDAAANVEGVSEIQQVSVDGSSGTFQLGFDLNEDGVGTNVTPSINFGASATAVQTALESLSDVGTGDVLVQKFGNTYRVHFKVNLADTAIPLMTANDSNLSSEGSIDELRVDDYANLSDTQGVLTSTSITGLGMGGFGEPGIVRTFNEIQTLRVDADGGTFELSIALSDGVGGTVVTPSVPLDHDVDAATLKSELDRLLADAYELSAGEELVDVARNDDVYVLRFVGLLSNMDVPQLSVDDSSLTTRFATGTSGSAETATRIDGIDSILRNEVQVLDLTGASGTFTLSLADPSNATPTLDVGISEGDLLLALEGLAGVRAGDVQVAEDTGVYTITFQGELTGTDLPTLSVDSSGLQGQPANLVATVANGLDTGLDDVQVLTVNATSGTFTLTLRVAGVVNPIVTEPIAANSSAEFVRRALQDALAIELTDATSVADLADKPEAFKNDFRVVRIGQDYVIGFQGVTRQVLGGAGVGKLQVDDSGLSGGNGATVNTRMDGINYYGFEKLDVQLGSGHDVFNVQGTSTGSYKLDLTTTHAATNVSLGDGDDQIFVSSHADLDQLTSTTTAGNDDRFDFLTGDLDQIDGNLNLIAEAGRHRLLISDEAAVVGDTGVTISDQIGPATAAGTDGEDDLTAAQIQIQELAKGDITYGTTGNFYDGVRYWLGSGNDQVRVDGTHRTLGVTGQDRTPTLLNAGLGDDDLTLDLDATEDGFFVVHASGGAASALPEATFSGADDDTIDASTSTLPLILFGGFGEDSITGGQSDDVILGDFGRVEFRDSSGQLVTHVGFGGRGDLDSPLRFGNEPLDFDLVQAVDLGIGGNDQIDSEAGADVVLGGSNGTDGRFSTERIAGGADDDRLMGDHGRLTFDNGEFRRLESTDTSESVGGRDVVIGEEGADVILGGVGGDLLVGDVVLQGSLASASDSEDILVGDAGVVIHDLSPADGFPNASGDSDDTTLDLIRTTDTALGGVDTIIAGQGNDIVLGGRFGDVIDSGDGNDLVFGDYASIQGSVDASLLPLAESIPSFTFTSIEITDPNAGNDVLLLRGGDDIALGQQGDDTIRGGDGDDDLLGGHNVTDGHDGNDAIDGGTGNDVVVGDNATIQRLPLLVSPDKRFQALTASNIYDPKTGELLVDGIAQLNPDVVALRDVTLMNHDVTTSALYFGSDYLAGGADDDVMFGQLGDDTLQGDGSIDVVVSATVHADGQLTLQASVEDYEGQGTDGDDYLEGNGGDDLVFGNLGQDDIIGGSSNLFGVDSAIARVDGSDKLFGGSGTRVDRNVIGDLSLQGHSRDADVILGDNGRVHRLVDGNGVLLSFNYDTYTLNQGTASELGIVPRGFHLLDYTVGGDASDVGGSDLVFGGPGDDIVHGMTGSDVLFGNGHNDDLYGGTGDERIFGGSGVDGIIADDGLLLTSRNGLLEPLHSVNDVNPETTLSTPGTFTGAVVNIVGLLRKDARLFAREIGGDDIAYGGTGDDWIHSGAGDDALSGAEALDAFYYNVLPQTGTPPIAYDPSNGTLEYFNPEDPRSKVNGFLLNFEAFDAAGIKIEDGKDHLFGDLGNDWIVGGTGHDRMFGGRGDDVMNADDNLENGTVPGANDLPDDPEYADGDFAFGGDGRDVMIANTGHDRLFDWRGEYNSYFVPFSPFGAPTVVRAGNPQIREFLLDLGAASGADTTLNEPDGELGLSKNGDVGKPRDPQPGNLNGSRDTQGAPEDDRGKALTVDGSTPGDVVVSTNAASQLGLDTNGDQAVTALDALLIVNALNTTFEGEDVRGRDHLDVNGDGSVTALDAILVINHLRDPIVEAEVAAPEARLSSQSGLVARLHESESDEPVLDQRVTEYLQDLAFATPAKAPTLESGRQPDSDHEDLEEVLHMLAEDLRLLSEA